MKRCLAAVLLLMSSPAWADDKVEITHAPSQEPGDRSHVRIETNIEQTLTIAGMPLPTTVEQFIGIDEEVAEINSDGEVTSTGNIDFCVFRLTLPDGREFSFDSGNPQRSNGIEELAPLEDLFRALMDANWISTFDADHTMTSLEYEGDPFSQLDEAVRSEVSPEKWMRMTNVEMARYPDGPVAVGDTWTRTEPVDIGSGQTMTFETEYEYLGTMESGGVVFDRISSSPLSVVYKMESNPNIPLNVTESDLTVESSEGELHYNRDLKMITNAQQTVHITGPMTFEANGQVLPGELDLTMTVMSMLEPQ